MRSFELILWRVFCWYGVSVIVLTLLISLSSFFS
jgi:hypothetical protein